MYTIGEVGYGYSLPASLQEYAEKEGLLEIIDGMSGVHTYYSGNCGPTPLIIGVEITTITATENVDLDSLINELGPCKKYDNDIKMYVKEIIGELTTELTEETPNLREVIKYLQNNKPKRIIVWSTS
jgi:hypothetical protein